ncbi:hypothetical protein GCM10022252_18960 [Streptosporangium oxazolinicum]|uniref:SseB protein N-terminal domain-containing protein n=1 Tax=Streptosporangium oxazolinicum TaxID=909287 RepID=A0ABP8AN47_9ACTN
MSEVPLYVPVREGAFSTSLRLFRTDSGRRTAAAFSSPMRLTKALGTGQRWIRLTEPALRHLIEDLDVTGIVIDPAGTTAHQTSSQAA